MTFKTLTMAAGLLALAACGNSSDSAALRGANFATNQNGTDITLSFDANEMRVNGQVVNLYHGTYTTDGNKIKFENMGSTMMMGPEDAMQVEQEYFQFLSTVDTYDLSGGKLTLKNNEGKEIVFQRVKGNPEAAVVTVEETEVVTTNN